MSFKQFNRLYADHFENKKSIALLQEKIRREREEAELRGVTFKPEILKANPTQMEKPRGFEIAVDRMKIAQDQREIKRLIYENIGRPGHDPASIYQEMEKTGVRSLSKNKKERSSSQVKSKREFKKKGNEITKKKKELIINVEITVAPGKIGYLPLHADDSPTELANNFSRIYSMSDDQKAVLKGILVSYKQKYNTAPQEIE